jgi:hypothetical protein
MARGDLVGIDARHAGHYSTSSALDVFERMIMWLFLHFKNTIGFEMHLMY